MKEIAVTREFIYHKFDEKKNEIVVDNEKTYTATRSMTIEEAKQYKKEKRLLWFLRIVSIILFLAIFSFAFFAVLFEAQGLKSLIPTLCFFLCILSLAFFIRFLWTQTDKIENLLEYFSNSGFIIENMTWEMHELIVNDEAKRWRESHPLEEKIRLAKESGNCVDIAAVLKYCGEDLVNNIKH